jgi:hypothetical protein
VFLWVVFFWFFCTKTDNVTATISRRSTMTVEGGKITIQRYCLLCFLQFPNKRHQQHSLHLDHSRHSNAKQIRSPTAAAAAAEAASASAELEASEAFDMWGLFSVFEPRVVFVALPPCAFVWVFCCFL